MRPAHILLLTLLAASPPGHTDPLGRLFLTPEERHPPSAGTNVAAKSTPESTINGFIRSSRGDGTIWINGRAQALASDGKPSRDVSETLPNSANPTPEPPQ